MKLGTPLNYLSRQESAPVALVLSPQRVDRHEERDGVEPQLGADRDVEEVPSSDGREEALELSNVRMDRPNLVEVDDEDGEGHEEGNAAADAHVLEEPDELALVHVLGR